MFNSSSNQLVQVFILTAETPDSAQLDEQPRVNPKAITANVEPVFFTYSAEQNGSLRSVFNR